MSEENIYTLHLRNNGNSVIKKNIKIQLRNERSFVYLVFNSSFVLVFLTVIENERF